jgi:hypothetical protein
MSVHRSALISPPACAGRDERERDRVRHRHAVARSGTLDDRTIEIGERRLVVLAQLGQHRLQLGRGQPVGRLVDTHRADRADTRSGVVRDVARHGRLQQRAQRTEPPVLARRSARHGVAPLRDVLLGDGVEEVLAELRHDVDVEHERVELSGRRLHLHGV